MKPSKITFRFNEEPWELHVYETVDRHGERRTRVAAYCLADALPRGPRRAWSLDNGHLTPWEPRDEGEWSELDVVARMALNAAQAHLDAELPRRSA